MTTAAEYQEVALSASATETLHYPNGFQLSFPSVAFPPAPASPLLAIAPGPTRIVRSSMSLSWQGLLLEKHLSFLENAHRPPLTCMSSRYFRLTIAF